MNKEEILNYLKKYKLDSNKFIIIGSATLVLKGLKEKCTDIDIAVSKEYNKALLKQFACTFERQIDNHKVYIIDNIINFSTHYFDKYEGEIQDGYKVQKIQELLDLKQKLNREKDQKDIEIITNYLNAKSLNSLSLAYLGDAVYELYIRTFLIQKNYKVKNMQEKAIQYVSAKAQSKFLDKMIDDNFLNQDEIEIIKRARNHKVTSHPKTTSILTYKKATGLEALIGFLKIIKNEKRINQIMEYIVGD